MDNLTISRRLAAHVAETRREDLPAAALESSKHMALDTFAMAWAGMGAPGIAEVRDEILEEGGHAQASVWGVGRSTSARSAAFLNSAAAAALDFDGMRATERGSVHSDSVVLPAAVAVAERCGASGRDLLAALVLGNDVVTRLGAASELPHRGWYLTSVYGVIGAAAAASRLLALDAEATMHALGIAINQACATQLPNIERSLVKRYSSSFAAQAGVTAALMAHRGVTAARASFEGRFGFFDLYQPCDALLLFDGLGAVYPHAETTVKRYPSCACNHTAIEAALRLAERCALQGEDIAEVEVVISPYVDRLVGAPFDLGVDPQVAAQFSVQYSVGSALLRRRFVVDDIEPLAVQDAAVVRFAQAIRVRVDEAQGNSRAATVRVKTRDGTWLEQHVQHIPGSAAAPLSAADRLVKAQECLQSGPARLDAAAADRFASRVLRMETLSATSSLFSDL